MIVIIRQSADADPLRFQLTVYIDYNEHYKNDKIVCNVGKYQTATILHSKWYGK